MIDEPQSYSIEYANKGQTRKFRLEEIEATSQGLRIRGSSLIATLDDAPRTCSWSQSSVSAFREVTQSEISTARPDRFEFGQGQNQNSYSIAPKKGETFGGGAGVGPAGIASIPTLIGSDKTWLSYMYRIRLNIPSGWRLRVQVRSRAWGLNLELESINGTGAVQTLTSVYTGTSGDEFLLYLEDTNATTRIYGGETGASFVEIQEVRVTSTSLRVQTSLSALVTAGSNKTLSVGSVAGLYVGQRVTVGTGATGETVTVKSIGASSFVADLALGHSAAEVVRAPGVYDSDVVKDLLTRQRALNTYSGLESSSLQIQTSSLDLVQYDYRSSLPTKILADLSKRSGYDWFVDYRGYLIYRPAASGTLFYSRVASLNLTRSQSSVYNAVRVRYRTAAGGDVVTSDLVDSFSASQNPYRLQEIDLDTTSQTEAEAVRAVALSSSKDRKIELTTLLSTVRGLGGVRADPDTLTRGDRILITNLPTTFSQIVDRTLVIDTVDIDLVSGQMTVTPFPLQDNLAIFLAALAN